MASASPSFVSQSFPNSIAEKLDDLNYLFWRQHVDLVIKSRKLQRFVVNLVVPLCYLNEENRVADYVNPDNEAWEVQDQTFIVWLQSTISKSVLSCILGFNHSYQIWEKDSRVH